MSTFGKVALLMGGFSNERDVSLKSGDAVYKALKRLNVDVTAIDMQKNVSQVLNKGSFDRVFNILHGRGGEDGQIQALLEFLDLPYTGSGVSASAIAMNKLLTKKIWQSEGLPTPKWKEINSETDCEKAITEMGLPLIIKPVLEGSSVGISKANSLQELVNGWQTAKEFGVVIAEQWVEGEEYTVSILGDKVLPAIRLKPNSDFYDYKAKYLSDDTQYFCPCGLDKDKENEIKLYAKKAFSTVGAEGWGRVDFMLNKNNDAFLIELNTVPGMTDHSLVPMAAKEYGLSFDELVIEVLKTTLQKDNA